MKGHIRTNYLKEEVIHMDIQIFDYPKQIKTVASSIQFPNIVLLPLLYEQDLERQGRGVSPIICTSKDKL